MMAFRALSLLWLLAIVPFALVLFVVAERQRVKLARRFVAERLRGVKNPARAIRPWLLALGLLASIVAFAGPYAGYRVVPIVATEANRVIVMDVSNSMAAQDVGTSRLAGAKAIAKRITEAQVGRVALLTFERDSEVVSPLTTDTDAVVALIDTLDTGEIGAPGSDIGGAVLDALRLIEADPLSKSDIVVISDGEDQGVRTREAIQRAKVHGIAVSTILVGSSRGSTIPTPQGPMRDDSGQTVTTYARADVLDAIAQGTGGQSYENPFAEHALDPLLAAGANGKKRATTARVPVDRYQWPLAFALVALIGASFAHRGAE